jgi:hypothetical protein
MIIYLPPTDIFVLFYKKNDTYLFNFLYSKNIQDISKGTR